MPLHKVLHYQRKPRPVGNYSLEAIFEDVRSRLRSEINIQQRIAPCFSNGLVRRLWILLDAAMQRGDVVHITGDINFAALLVSKKRSVLTIPDCFKSDMKKGISGWLFRALWFRWPVRSCGFVTTISEASKRDIVRLTGCNPEKVRVIGVAISPRFQRIDRDFNTNLPRILQVGAAPNKNIERLAAALENLPCRLVIVGEINEPQRIALRTHKIDFEHYERLSEDAIHEQYVLADIVAFASTLEGFGMPIIEGNAIGRPVVTGNCTSMPEVAGNAACLVDPFDVASIRAGIIRVIEDADYRQQLVQNGFVNARRFDPDEIAKQYLAVYQYVASSGRKKN